MKSFESKERAYLPPLVPGFEANAELDALAGRIGHTSSVLNAAMIFDLDKNNPKDQEFIERSAHERDMLIEEHRDVLERYLRPYLDIELPESWEGRSTSDPENKRWLAAVALKNYYSRKET